VLNTGESVFVGEVEKHSQMFFYFL